MRQRSWRSRRRGPRRKLGGAVIDRDVHVVHPTVRRSTPAAPRLRFVVLMGGETGARRWPNAEAASLLYPRDLSLFPGVTAWRLSASKNRRMAQRVGGTTSSGSASRAIGLDHVAGVSEADDKEHAARGAAVAQVVSRTARPAESRSRCWAHTEHGVSDAKARR